MKSISLRDILDNFLFLLTDLSLTHECRLDFLAYESELLYILESEGYWEDVEDKYARYKEGGW